MFDKMKASQKLTLVLLVIAIMGIASTIFLGYQYQKAKREIQTIRTDPTVIQKAAQAEVKQLLDQIGKLIDLPQKESPTVATVIDSQKLKSQPFFAKAKNGDKIIIYTEAKKAIIYRPSTNKIVDVAPVTIGENQKTPLKAAIYNGTGIAGLAGSIEKQLKDKVVNIDVVLKEDAKTDYQKTLVVDFTGKQKETASQIANLLNGEVGSLPNSETKPDSDLLVILGKGSIAVPTVAPTTAPTTSPNATPSAR